MLLKKSLDHRFTDLQNLLFTILICRITHMKRDMEELTEEERQWQARKTLTYQNLGMRPLL